MSTTVVMKLIRYLILVSVLSAGVQGSACTMRFSASLPGPHGLNLRSERVGTIIGETIFGNDRPSVPLMALSQSPVPRRADMALLAALGSALLVLARVLRKIPEKRTPTSKAMTKARGVGSAA